MPKVTELRRAVYRKSVTSYNIVYAGNARPVVIGLEPGDVLTFREAGRWKRYSLPLSVAFRLAVENNVKIGGK